MELKSVGVFRCGIICAILYGLMGVVEGVFILVLSAFAPNTSGPGMPKAFGIGIAFAMPIFTIVAGFLGGVLTAWLYNLIARWVGGIQLHLEPIGEPEPKY